MDLWQRACSLAEEAGRRSQDLRIGSFQLSEMVSEAAKLSMDIAANASRRAESIKSHIPTTTHTLQELNNEDNNNNNNNNNDNNNNNNNMERFGVTDDLRDFVKGITANTFRDFPLQDDSEVSDTPTVSNVRQDLTAWQEKHAKIVLSTVKEISKLRYELCPRAMKERKFWRIYFILVNSHVSPYEKRYTEEAILKAAEEAKNDKRKESSTSGTLSKSEVTAVNQKSKTSSANEQDLDVFLLGDLGDSDEGPDDGDQDFDDDFDKL